MNEISERKANQATSTFFSLGVCEKSKQVGCGFSLDRACKDGTETVEEKEKEEDSSLQTSSEGRCNGDAGGPVRFAAKGHLLTCSLYLSYWIGLAGSDQN